MNWTIIYHQAVEYDLGCISSTAARLIMRTVDTKLTEAPVEFGAPLSGNLANFRKLRVGDYRFGLPSD